MAITEKDKVEFGMFFSLCSVRHFVFIFNYSISFLMLLCHHGICENFYSFRQIFQFIFCVEMRQLTSILPFDCNVNHFHVTMTFFLYVCIYNRHQNDLIQNLFSPLTKLSQFLKFPQTFLQIHSVNDAVKI